MREVLNPEFICFRSDPYTRLSGAGCIDKGKQHWECLEQGEIIVTILSQPVLSIAQLIWFKFVLILLNIVFKAYFSHLSWFDTVYLFSFNCRHIKNFDIYQVICKETGNGFCMILGVLSNSSNIWICRF